MEKEVKFKVGKWYKNLGRNSQKDTFGKFLDLRNNDKEFCMSEYIYKGKFTNAPGWIDYSSETVEINIEEIQQYLPEGHPDKIKSNDFKVGDYVVIIKSSKNWVPKMNTEVGKIVQITDISDTSYINYEGKPYWVFGARDEHFRHATPEEINNHLLSIGQIPTGEPLNTGIEPNKDGMFKYTTHTGTTYVDKTSTISEPLKITLSIDDEELPMVSIIKTNTIKQLLNND